MHTIGVDLAAQAKGTYACRIAWARVPRVELLAGDLDDARLAAVLREDAAIAGLDVPFGWPDAFVALLAGRREFGSWEMNSRDLRLRATDRFVHAQTQLPPMSVSSDRIAAPAMRWRILRANAGLTSAHFREVYPAAALKHWTLPHRGYKLAEQRAVRVAILEAIVERLGLSLTDAQASLARETADALDAIVAALVARAVAIAKCVPLPDEHRAIAVREGWIELPDCDLAALR